MKRKRIIIILSAVCLCLGAALLWVAQLETQPRYNGKTVDQLSRIVAESDRVGRQMFGRTDEQIAEALAGLNALGPRAEKALIIQMNAKDTRWRRTYKAIWLRCPRFVARMFPPYVEATYLRNTAVLALGKLGPLSPQSEQALVLACRDPDVIVRTFAVGVLNYRGSRRPETLQALEEAMRDPTVAALVSSENLATRFDYRPRSIEVSAAVRNW